MTVNNPLRAPLGNAPVVTDFTRRVYCVLGLPFDAVDTEQTVQAIRAAGGEAIRDIPDTADASEGVATQIADKGPENANGKNDISLSEQEEVYMISSNGPDMSEVTVPSILPIAVDENGIYALLAKKEKQAA